MKAFQAIFRISAFLLGLNAVAATVQTVVVSSTQPSSTACSAPPASTAFSAANSAIYEYVDIQAMNAGDMVSMHWVANSQWVWTTTWNNPIQSGGNWCFTGGSLPQSQFSSGSWQLEVFVNGQELGQTSFTISGSGPTNPASSNYRGSFDAVDCAHIYGWAQDTNNPNNTISVDIYVDGVRIATQAAGDYRVDLANAGIGNHAFNYYGLPATLTNGQSHTVRVTYSGTTTDLPGSPKNFQNSCGATPTNVPTWTYSTLPNLAGLAVVVQKQLISSTTYQYRFNIISQTGGLSDTVSTTLSLVAPHDPNIKVHRTSFTGQVIYANSGPTSGSQILQNVDAAPWQPVSSALNNTSAVTKDVLGAFPIVGTALNLGAAYQDLLNIFGASTPIGPSGTFDSEVNSDDYDLYGTDVYTSSFPVIGTRITVNVDELGTEHPDFFVLIKESGNTLVSLELRDDYSTPIIQSASD